MLNNSKKGFSMLLVILLVLIISGTAILLIFSVRNTHYNATSTSDPTGITSSEKSNKKDMLELLNFPEGTDIKKGLVKIDYVDNGYEHIGNASVTINSIVYYLDYVNVHPGGAWCSNEDFWSTCGYTDVQLKDPVSNSYTPIIRIWEDESGVFMLNPQHLYINDGAVRIFKDPLPNRPISINGDIQLSRFTENEIDLWTNIFKDAHK
jgi:hypothetical protein